MHERFILLLECGIIIALSSFPAAKSNLTGLQPAEFLPVVGEEEDLEAVLAGMAEEDFGYFGTVLIGEREGVVEDEGAGF